MKKVAIGGMLVSLAFIIAGAFWIAYRDSAENDKAADETFVQSPVVATKKTTTTPNAPAEKPENAEEIAQNEETATSAKAPAGAASGEISNLIPSGYERYGRIAYTRQGKPYRLNPDWDDAVGNPDLNQKGVEAARTMPAGVPLSHDWAKADGPNKMIGPFETDWLDPRTWESYRNFWGFDPPLGSGDGTFPYIADLDNWGRPFQQFGNSPTVIRYGKRKGFRPSPEQLDQYLSLEADRNRARHDGNTILANILGKAMNALTASAQGELPVTHSAHITYIPSSVQPKPPKEKREQTALAIRNLYRRLGIGHLYDFYENPDFRKTRNLVGRP